MPFLLRVALSIPMILGPVFAADERPKIHFEVKSPEPDSQALPPSIPLLPPSAAETRRFEPPPLSGTLFPIMPLDSLGTGKRAFDFSEYWSRVERENGIDDLRMQLGMLQAYSKLPISIPEGARASRADLLGPALLLYRTWKTHEEDLERERRFRLKVDGLIDLAYRLEGRKGASPAVSIIVAKLDFMGKRMAGKLPSRPDRRRFTETLKAWAVNPVFDSTGLGPALMEVCRLYEEHEP
jgi:hypothetical protein